MAKRKRTPKSSVHQPNPLNRCPDCNAKPQGIAVYHESGCPHFHAMEAQKWADAEWLADHPGEMFLERPITATELDELRWIMPEGIDAADLPDLVVVGIAHGQRVRGFKRSGADR